VAAGGGVCGRLGRVVEGDRLRGRQTLTIK
jgi:hypothetical protein